MQNTENCDYIKKSNVINLKSEILFREAEDDFYFFNEISKARKKLKEAINLTPNHTKSIVLYADVLFTQGKIKKSLEMYIRANNILQSNPKIVAAIANCYFSLQMYDLAVKYSQNALKLIRGTNFSLYSQIIEIKINSLISLKKYSKAYYLYEKAKNYLSNENQLSFDYSNLKEKLELREKIVRSQLKII